MSIEENKALVRRFYAELDNLNPAVIDELVAENFVNHSPPPFPVEQGRDGLKQAFELFRRATPGSHEILDQVAEGDKGSDTAARRWHTRGRPSRNPENREQIGMTATVVHRIENGKIVEKWSDRDEMALLQQLGVVSLPEGPS